MNHQQKYAQFTIAIACILVFGMNSFLPVLGHSKQNGTIKKDEIDGSRRGRPGNRKGTGSRGNCPSVNIPVTALMPENNQGLTVEEYPQLWVFVPYKSNNIVRGEFVLQDERNNDIYRKNFILPATPGIVSVNLAPIKPLEINKDYQWYFKLYCSQQKLSNSLFARGWIKRIPINPNLARQLKTAVTPQQRFSIYNQNNIWYSAVTELAKQHLESGNNNSLGDWGNLLKGVGLESLISQPLVGEVKFSEL